MAEFISVIDEIVPFVDFVTTSQHQSHSMQYFTIGFAGFLSVPPVEELGR
ncbi:hypothetical protein [Qipengyuania flava]|nr:hypothetical protein [Qipengyuania flava]